MQPQRLFEIIYTLMNKGHCTSAELAETLEVSERTIRRDIEALSSAGVPVYLQPGKGGGMHVLSFNYLDSSKNFTRREVEPAKLLFKEKSWYLRAWCRARRDWRTFKLFRIDWPSLQVQRDTFEPRTPPPLEEHATSLKAERLILRFSPEAEEQIREEFAPSVISRRSDKEGWQVDLYGEINERFCFYLLSFGARLEVEKPVWLRRWLRDEALNVAKHYGNSR